MTRTAVSLNGVPILVIDPSPFRCRIFYPAGKRYCIRIATLLDYLEIDATGRRAYSTIYQLSEATVHIPRWQQWQDLTPERRAEFRKQKEALEQAHGEELRQALQTLLEIDV